MSGFVSEFLALIGAFGVRQWQTIVSVTGIVVSAAYMLMVLQRVLLGPLREQWRALPDANLRELVSLVPLLVIVLALGIYPLLMLQVQDASLQRLIAHVTGGL